MYMFAHKERERHTQSIGGTIQGIVDRAKNFKCLGLGSLIRSAKGHKHSFFTNLTRRPCSLCRNLPLWLPLPLLQLLPWAGQGQRQAAQGSIPQAPNRMGRLPPRASHRRHQAVRVCMWVCMDSCNLLTCANESQLCTCLYVVCVCVWVYM